MRHLWILIIAACTDIAGPRARFTPPDAWRTWYAEVGACAGIAGDFDAIRWYVVVGSSETFAFNGARARAAWRWPHSIFLAERAGDPSASLEDVVRHEMLHDLLQIRTSDPVAGHPSPLFGVCAAL